MRPSRTLLLAASLWLLLGLATAVWEPGLQYWAGLGGGLVLLSLVDLWTVRRFPDLSLVRRVATSLPLGVWSPVQLHLSNPGTSWVRLEVFDHYPPGAELEGLPWRVTVPAGGWTEIEYRIRPERRGDQVFEPAEVLLHSRGWLWQRRQRVGERRTIRVLPNFRSVAKYAFLAIDDRLGQMGIRLQQRRGQGLEFQQLREYRMGDSLRQVDWKATSKRQKLISKEYQDEKDQQVVFLVDCGRRMHARDGELSHFDHVLNTVLLLTHVALNQGDAVGLMTFSGESRWVAPVKGGVALATILESTYDLETSSLAPDYLKAATRLMTLQRRRALIILISNLRDEDAEEVLPAIDLLRRRNLVLLASLREAALEEVLAHPPSGFRDALLKGATHHYLLARRGAHERVKGRGVLTLDVQPEELPVRLVNRYLDIKRSGLL